MKLCWLDSLKHRLGSRPRSRRRPRRLLSATEAFESRILLSGTGFDHGSGSHGDHHHAGSQAVLGLVDPATATNIVVADGNWSDPTVWSDNTLPANGARVVIPEGRTVTVDRVLAEDLKTVRVDGTLEFASDRDTQLRVDTLVTSPTGTLRIGTAAQPLPADVSARVVFTDDGPIDRDWDPQQFSRGALLLGTTEIHGAETTHRSVLAAQPRAGEDTLQLTSAPAGWEVGDQVVITGTQGATSDEVRMIAGVAGNTVQLDQPLALDHVAPAADLNVYVANTTRNVEFTSENPALDRRGHVMFMHTRDVDVNHAAFTQLGRTNKSEPLDDVYFDFTDDAVGNETSAGVVFTTRPGPGTNIRGRYSVHVHRGGTDPASSPINIGGNVVVDSPGWGFVNHSSNVNFVDNVAYNVEGASFYTEAGDEIGAMVGNLAIRSVSPAFTLDEEGAIDPDLRGDVQDFGVDGEGFWLSGHLVSLRENVSAGATGHGIIIWSDGLVEADVPRGRASVRVADIPNGDLIPGRETIPTWWAPLAEISGNESYGATIGFRSRYVHSSVYLGENGSAFHTPPPQAYIDTLNPVVDDLTVWGSRDGVLLNYNERLSLTNSRLVGTGAPWVRNGGTADTGVGIDLYNEVSRGPGVIENVVIEGFEVGLLAPRQDDWAISNLHLSNVTDLFITEPRQGARTLDMSGVTFGSLDGTAVDGREGARQNVVMEADLEPIGFQPFAFLLPDRISLNGQGLYFNEQAADHVPVEEPFAREELIAAVPDEFAGLTNQQLHDTYGTSFGGALIPGDAEAVAFVSGGVVGSPAADPTVTPPLYDMIGEGGDGLLADPGNLRNFDTSVLEDGVGADDDEEDEEDEGDDADHDDDCESDDDESDDDESDDDESDEDESDEDESDDDESDDDESDEDESDEDESDDDESDDDESDDDESDEDESDDDESDDDESDDDESDDDESDDDESDDDESDDDESDDDESDDESDDDESDDDESDDDESDDDESDDDESDDDESDDDESDDDESDDDESDDDESDDDESDDDESDEDESDEDESDDDEAESCDVFPVEATLTGTSESEKLQGFESDDTIIGGGGADLFPFTTGQDVIMDFDPSEDMLDVGDFARAEGGFEVLTSLDALADASTVVMVDGVESLQIDVDGEHGTSTTTLVGVSLDDLTASNVFFGLDGTSIPPLEFTHFPEVVVLYSDDGIVEFPAHDLTNHPIEGIVVQEGEPCDDEQADDDEHAEDDGECSGEDESDEDQADDDESDDDESDDDESDEDESDEDESDEDESDEDESDEDESDEDESDEDESDEDESDEDESDEDESDEDESDEDESDEDESDDDESGGEDDDSDSGDGDEDNDPGAEDDDDQSDASGQTLVVQVPESGERVTFVVRGQQVLTKVGGQVTDRADLGQATTLRIDGTAQPDRVRVNVLPMASDRLQTIVISGADGDDVLEVRTRPDVFGGEFVVAGDAGHDVVNARRSHAPVRADGGRGRDTLKGGHGDDVLVGGGGSDKMMGFAGADRLFGGGGSDKVVGGTGDDTLRGGAGNDLVNGQEGIDVFLEQVSEASTLTDSGFDGLGRDRLRHVENAALPGDGSVTTDGFTGSLLTDELFSDPDSLFAI